MTDWFYIIAGLAILITAAEFLVRGSVWVALSLGMSQMMVGLTLVAFGTSAPELFTSLSAALGGSTAMATSNVIGSNIANVGLIVGLTCLWKPLTHEAGGSKFEFRFMVGSGLLLFIPIVFGTDITSWHGIGLLSLIVFFTYALVQRARAHRRVKLERNPSPKLDHSRMAAVLNITWILAGLVGLYFGGKLLVHGGQNVATQLGMSDGLVGLTIIALGTSLPELVTSLMAARKGHPEIAIGNVVGSNIFNVCMVLGVTSTVIPLPLGPDAIGDIVVASLLTVLMAGMIRFQHGIRRPAGGLLLSIYLGYMIYSIATA